MGLAERELLAIDELIARKQAANPKIDYAAGWRMLLSERGDLMQSYSQAATARDLEAIDREIIRRRTANPELDYMRCWMLLAGERSPLIIAYNDAAGMRPPQSRLSGGRRDGGAGHEHPLASVLVPLELQIRLLRHENPNLTWGDAWKRVEQTHPELVENYNKAAGHKPGETAAETLARVEALIDEQVRNARQRNPSLLYHEALKQVEEERPDLFWARKDASGRAGQSATTPSQRTAPVEEGGPGTRGAVAMRANPLARELGAIDDQIVRMREANPKLGYADAWVRISREMPHLIQAYNSAAARVFVGRQ